MTLHPSEEHLHRFADGELEAGEAAAIEAHLTTCLACAGFVQRVYRLSRLARRAPKGLAPPADLWPGILEEASGRGLVRGGRRLPRLRRQAIAVLAAAAVLGVLLLRPDGRPAGPRQQVPPPTVVRTGPPPTPAALVLSETEEVGAELVSEFEARKRFLQPETIATVERNLRIINAAIEDTRRALERDPGNVHLEEMLQRSRRQKIEYLQTAITLASL